LYYPVSTIIFRFLFSVFVVVVVVLRLYGPPLLWSVFIVWFEFLQVITERPAGFFWICAILTNFRLIVYCIVISQVITGTPAVFFGYVW